MKKQSSADLLIAAREKSGLTQTQMARIAKTSQSAIAAYEAGDREPTVPVLQRMLADIPVTAADIRRMGSGGLLMEIVTRPQPRSGEASHGEE